MRQLDAQESGGVGGHGSSQGGTEAGEEGLVAALAVQLADDAADGDVALGGLQAGLDGVNGENGDPHGNTRSSSSACHSSQAELAAGLASNRIDGGQTALDILVGGEVGGGTGTVTGEGGGGASEDAADAALAVELADDVDSAVVLGLLAGGQLLLALDLQNDLDALERGGNRRHGDGGEETGGGDLGDGEALGPDGGDGGDELLAEIVAPEGDGDWGGDVST